MSNTHKEPELPNPIHVESPWENSDGTPKYGHIEPDLSKKPVPGLLSLFMKPRDKWPGVQPAEEFRPLYHTSLGFIAGSCFGFNTELAKLNQSNKMCLRTISRYGAHGASVTFTMSLLSSDWLHKQFYPERYAD
jgi:hypothetical protein